jgi:hypothetical protein
MNPNKPFLNSPLQKAAEFSGAAGEFRYHSLHRSQISKDLCAMQARVAVWPAASTGKWRGLTPRRS